MEEIETLEIVRLKTMEEIRKHIQACEGRHAQQVAYSTFHDALTQICYGCKVVRTMLYFGHEKGIKT